MKTITSINALRKELDVLRSKKKCIGFVPTMGFFHEGHLSLMRRARKENDIVVVSLFVNPTQFAEGEDLDTYPRDMERDAKMADEVGVDYIFAPTSRAMYPDGYGTYVENDTISDLLCGVSRPGHFRGVATVVAKLLNIVEADRAYFGQKDYQQLCVLKLMARDLNMRTKVFMCPIVREKDGLAMSSRNVYLSERERMRALNIHVALKHARTMIQDGERRPREIIAEMKEIIKTSVDKIDYIALLSADTLESVTKLHGKIFIGVAAYMGGTRLIDNTIITVK